MVQKFLFLSAIIATAKVHAQPSVVIPDNVAREHVQPLVAKQADPADLLRWMVSSAAPT